MYVTAWGRSSQPDGFVGLQKTKRGLYKTVQLNTKGGLFPLYRVLYVRWSASVYGTFQVESKLRRHLSRSGVNLGADDG